MESLLGSAANGGSVEIMSALLCNDLFVSLVRVVDEVDRPVSPLMRAAERGHRGVVTALIDAGAPLEYKNMLGGTALTTAV
ncbi:unnamed protein product, partial [Scytosiphon promiscuus]